MKATHTLPNPDSDTDMSPADLLRGASLYLARHGWVQGEFFDLLADQNFPPACSLGAINIAAHGRPILCADDTAEDPHTDAAIRAMRVLAAYLEPEYLQNVEPFAELPSAIDIVSGWNDDDSRTVAEVIQTLTDVADDWDGACTTGGVR